MDVREAVAESAFWQQVERKAKERGAFCRQMLQDAMESGDAVSASWEGQQLARAVKPKPTVKAAVSDPAGFREWVAERWPTEIETVEEILPHLLDTVVAWLKADSAMCGAVETVTLVRSAFREELLKRAVEKGALIDSDGEVCPYVEVTASDPSVRLTPTKDAPFIVAQMLSQSAISFDAPLEVEA